MNFRSILSLITQINFPVADVPFQLLMALPSPVIINAKNPYILINKLIVLGNLYNSWLTSFDILKVVI